MDAAIIPRLKQRLTEPLPGKKAQLKMAPSFRPDINKTENTTKAGVLLLLFPNPVELHLVLMKRPTYAGVHSDQISFPGGKFEPVDHTLIDSAIREAQEEVGVPSDSIQVLGVLTELYIPVSEIEVLPVIGFCRQKPIFRIDPKEVSYLIEEKVSLLFNPMIKGIKPFSNEKYAGDIPYYDIQGNHVWGATAMILNEFLEVLNDIK